MGKYPKVKQRSVPGKKAKDLHQGIPYVDQTAHRYSSVFLHLFPEKTVIAATGRRISGNTG